MHRAASCTSHSSQPGDLPQLASGGPMERSITIGNSSNKQASSCERATTTISAALLRREFTTVGDTRTFGGPGAVAVINGDRKPPEAASTSVTTPESTETPISEILSDRTGCNNPNRTLNSLKGVGMPPNQRQEAPSGAKTESIPTEAVSGNDLREIMVKKKLLDTPNPKIPVTDSEKTFKEARGVEINKVEVKSSGRPPQISCHACRMRKARCDGNRPECKLFITQNSIAFNRPSANRKRL